jgi:hypothetical protein
MHPNAQILLYQLPTLATALASVAWVNQYDTPASFFRFARRDEYELVPRRIRNAFRQAVVFEHALCIQVLKREGSETIDQIPTFLVCKVRTPIGDSLVDATDNFPAFHSLQTTLGSFSQFALRFRQFVFFGSEKARINDLLAIRQGCERFKTNIDTDCRLNSRQWLWFGFNAERNEPLASTTASDRNCLDPPFDPTMQDHLDRADFRQDKLLPVKSHTVAILRVGHTVVPAIALETRIASVLLACFQAPEEGFEGQIKANLHVLKHLRMNNLKRWSFDFPGWKEGLRIVQRKRRPPLLPAISAGCKRLVVDIAAFLKLMLEDTLLPFCRADAVFAPFRHTTMITLYRVNSKHVLYRVWAKAGHYIRVPLGGVNALGFHPYSSEQYAGASKQ